MLIAEAGSTMGYQRTAFPIKASLKPNEQERGAYSAPHGTHGNHTEALQLSMTRQEVHASNISLRHTVLPTGNCKLDRQCRLSRVEILLKNRFNLLLTENCNCAIPNILPLCRDSTTL
jgi:hypothetical protein